MALGLLSLEGRCRRARCPLRRDTKLEAHSFFSSISSIVERGDPVASKFASRRRVRRRKVIGASVSGYTCLVPDTVRPCRKLGKV